MRDVVIVGAFRSPLGSFGGAFKTVSAVKLGEAVFKATLDKVGVNPEAVDELIFGNVLQAGLGQNVARQVAVGAGLPIAMPSYTVNKVCGSGLKTVQLAWQSIACGESDIVIAGGTENMSQAPYLLMDARWGMRMGDGAVIDSMTSDGLTDVFNKYHMGVTAENIAEQFGITREDQDLLAVASQNKAEAAITSGRFKDEIIPIPVPQRKGDPLMVDTDEFPRFGATIESMGKLKPAFKKDGTVTAASSSGINDGAAVLILMSREKADELGIKPLVRILSSASAGVDPSIMGTGPIPASRKALEKAGLTMKDIGLVEANEAFAAQALCVLRDLEADMSTVNVNGGAIALGHPIGASGARILVTLIHEMKKRGTQYGLATLCIGGGQGISLIVEGINE